MQTPKRKRYQKDAAPSDDIITLIQLVRQNPALYNYKLQPNQRRRSDILNGWKDIAMQIGNKYTVEECRRKWKNLRDTYHQYRLRKSKVGDGLSKWRYAKELDFLSTVYQPKLKSHRIKYDQDYGVVNTPEMHDTRNESNRGGHNHHDDDDDDDSMVHHSNITLVSDDAETFILQAYEESVNDDVGAIDSVGEEPASIAHIELTPDDNVEDVVEIVKHEHHGTSSLDEDGATGADVDYEEVCLYEEAGNAPSVDCETIIGGGGGGSSCVPGGSSSPNDSKAFQYINTAEFCIEPVSITHANIVNAAALSCSAKSNLFKTISVLASPSATSSTALTTVAPTTSSCSSTSHAASAFLSASNNIGGGGFVQLQAQSQQTSNAHRRDELDLFFEFLKNKMQRLPQVDITGIQIEFLNCVLRREAESVHK